MPEGTQKVITYRKNNKTIVYTTAYDQDAAREAYMYCCARYGRKGQKIYDVEKGAIENES